MDPFKDKWKARFRHNAKLFKRQKSDEAVERAVYVPPALFYEGIFDESSDKDSTTVNVDRTPPSTSFWMPGAVNRHTSRAGPLQSAKISPFPDARAPVRTTLPMVRRDLEWNCKRQDKDGFCGEMYRAKNTVGTIDSVIVEKGSSAADSLSNSASDSDSDCDTEPGRFRDIRRMLSLRSIGSVHSEESRRANVTLPRRICNREPGKSRRGHSQRNRRVDPRGKGPTSTEYHHKGGYPPLGCTCHSTCVPLVIRSEATYSGMTDGSEWMRARWLPDGRLLLLDSALPPSPASTTRPDFPEWSPGHLLDLKHRLASPDPPAQRQALAELEACDADSVASTLLEFGFIPLLLTQLGAGLADLDTAELAASVLDALTSASGVHSSAVREALLSTGGLDQLTKVALNPTATDRTRQLATKIIVKLTRPSEVRDSALLPSFVNFLEASFREDLAEAGYVPPPSSRRSTPNPTQGSSTLGCGSDSMQRLVVNLPRSVNPILARARRRFASLSRKKSASKEELEAKTAIELSLELASIDKQTPVQSPAHTIVKTVPPRGQELNRAAWNGDWMGTGAPSRISSGLLWAPTPAPTLSEGLQFPPTAARLASGDCQTNEASCYPSNPTSEQWSHGCQKSVPATPFPSSEYTFGEESVSNPACSSLLHADEAGRQDSVQLASEESCQVSDLESSSDEGPASPTVTPESVTAVRALFHAALHKPNKSTIREAGAVPLLVQAVKVGSPQSRLVKESLRLLYSLALCEEGVTELNSALLCEPSGSGEEQWSLVDALEQGPPTVQESVAAIMLLLCRHGRFWCQKLVSEGVLCCINAVELNGSQRTKVKLKELRKLLCEKLTH